MSNNSKRINLLGVGVDALTIPQAIDLIVDRATSTHPPAYVVKPYVEFLDRATGDPAIRTILNQAWLVLPDGVSLNWAGYYLHGGRHNFPRLIRTLAEIVLAPRQVRRILPASFAGTNFTLPLLKAAAQHQLKVFLIGSPKHSSIEQTATYLQANLPGLQIVGTHSGHQDRDWHDRVVAKLRTNCPDLILVGMGFPRQEQAIVKLLPVVDHGVFIGEGGTFDYREMGGQHTKAPALWQRLGLEWLWRLILEPSRIARQLAIPRFIAKVYRAGR